MVIAGQDGGNCSRRDSNTEHREQEAESEISKEQADKESGEREVEAGDGSFREEVPRSTEEERDKD